MYALSRLGDSSRPATRSASSGCYGKVGEKVNFGSSWRSHGRQEVCWARTPARPASRSQTPKKTDRAQFKKAVSTRFLAVPQNYTGVQVGDINSSFFPAKSSSLVVLKKRIRHGHKKGAAPQQTAAIHTAEAGRQAFGGQLVNACTILVRQRARSTRPAKMLGRGQGDTLSARHRAT